MIEVKKGDIFQEDVEALVNSVNCVGVMGRGIALQFKNLFSENFKAYKKACDRNEVRPGRMFVYESVKMMNPRNMINFPTKRHWRGKSRIEDIDAGLEDLVRLIEELHIKSIAIPPLGTNLGGLSWSAVRPRIEAALEQRDNLAVTLFEPGSGTADGRPNRSTRVPKMTTGKASLICLIDRYLPQIHRLTAAGEVCGGLARVNVRFGAGQLAWGRSMRRSGGVRRFLRG